MAQLREGMSARFLLWTPALEHFNDAKKSSRVCEKCALKIRNASTVCELIKTALVSENNTYAWKVTKILPLKG